MAIDEDISASTSTTYSTGGVEAPLQVSVLYNRCCACLKMSNAGPHCQAQDAVLPCQAQTVGMGVWFTCLNQSNCGLKVAT